MECFIGVIYLVSALLTIEVYRRKGYGTGWGVLVGFMLGPLGLIVALVKADIRQSRKTT